MRRYSVAFLVLFDSVSGAAEASVRTEKETFFYFMSGLRVMEAPSFMNSSYVYTGSPIKPRFSLNIGNQLLESGTDFDVDITDNINVGTAHVLIKGKGRFKGMIERSFEITPVPARSLSFFADSTDFEYNGEPCVMQVAVKFGDKTLEEGSDYSVEYIDNDKPGKASARISFMGNFAGVMTIPFTIREAAPKAEELENLCTVSADRITLGESVTVNSAAKGGSGAYSYAVFYKKAESQKWTTVHRYTSDEQTEVRPLNATTYKICVKVKDEAANVAKKYFTIEVSRPAETM